MKEKLIKLLVKKGNNEEYAKKLVKIHFEYIQRVYADSTNSEKCDVMTTLGLN